MNGLGIERWSPDRHLEMLGRWLRDSGLVSSAGFAELYPPTGFVVDGCVAGFLYATNAPLVGYLDGLVSDPGAPKKKKYLAIDLLTTKLIEEAESLGIAMLFANTNHVGLLSICKRRGFKVYGDGFTCLVAGIRR